MTYLVVKVDNNWLLHRSFCHINFDNIVKVSSTFVIRNFPNIIKPTNVVFKESIMTKQHKVSFPRKKFTTIEKLEIIHIDLSDPT